MSPVSEESFLHSQHSFHNRQHSPEVDGVLDPPAFPTPLELEAGPGDRVPPSRYYPFHEI
ncbi:hypothetical protein ACMFMG_002830 [Clarireedia jacksonii]